MSQHTAELISLTVERKNGAAIAMQAMAVHLRKELPNPEVSTNLVLVAKAA